MSEEQREILKAVIQEYLHTNVNAPASETVEKDFYAIDSLGSLLIILQTTADSIREEGSDFDKEPSRKLTKAQWEEHVDILVKYIDTGQLSDKTIEILKLYSSKKYLLAYLVREVHWVAVSILSGSYISASVIMRSAFELLVGIATIETGTMNERISRMTFLSAKEKGNIQRLWSDLCAWAHPYNKWLKDVCPIFFSFKPMYHPTLCKQSLQKLEKIVDLLLIIAIEKFEINTKIILEKMRNHRINSHSLPMFNSRVEVKGI